MKNLKTKINFHSIAGIKYENQDACAYFIPDNQMVLEYKGIVAVIADGVSASLKAKEASRCCVDGFLSDYYSTPESWGVEHCATKVISALNNWLYSQSVRAKEEFSMLSTMSVLIIKSSTAHIFHVGDSRIYHYRSELMTQLTKDHVLNVNKQKTYLSRAMGFDLKVNVDYQTLDIKQHDRFLLTTDGVHDYLNQQDLQTLMSQGKESKVIVRHALNQGSNDNISALMLEIEQLPEKNMDEAFNELTNKPVPPDLEVGMKINGFEIKSLISSSSKMQLYQAKDVHTGQMVALKTPSVNFEDDAQYLKHFMIEKWAVKRIHSPNVVKAHHSEEKVQFLAYAMEYIKGQTLREWMDENKNPDMAMVVSFIKQIIQGIRAFHRQEMLHCDLKPENIMIDKIGQIKLIDFGSARIAGVAELLNPISTMNNQGTKGYSAPEAIIYDKVSQASDQFSLGVIVYEILAGCLPYGDKLDKNLNEKKLPKIYYESILKYDPHVPIWIDAAIQKACHLDINQRYETLSDFLYDLLHPNVDFLKTNKSNINQPKSQITTYRLLIATSFSINIVFLLLLIINYEL